MARFAKHITAFLLFAAPVYLLLLYFWGSFIPPRFQVNLFPRPDTRSFLRERIHELPAYRGADLLVLGPSLAQRGIDPRVFAQQGHRVFVLASGGQNPMQSLILLKRYVDSLKPKRVAFTIYPDLFVIDRTEPSLDLILSDHLDGENWKDALRRPDLRLTNTLLYWQMRQILGKQDPALRDSNRHDRYIPGGFLERRFPGSNKELLKACEPGPQLPLNPEHLRALDSCRALLARKGIPFFLLQLPLTSARYRCRTASTQIDSVFASRGAYYNFNGKVALNDTFDFSDNVHLTPPGAIKFSQALCAQLEKDGLLRTQPQR